MFEIMNDDIRWTTTNDGRTPKHGYTISLPMSIWLRRAEKLNTFKDQELKQSEPKSSSHNYNYKKQNINNDQELMQSEQMSRPGK